MGKCPDCGTWDSLEETLHDPSAELDPQKGLVSAWSAIGENDAAPPSGGATPIASVNAHDAPASRLSSTISELDRVLGGGLVPGSAILLGGEPGIGKSTLMLQAARGWATRGHRALYASSEESAQQVRLRAGRLSATLPPELFVLAETNLARVVEQIRRVLPAVVVIDSIQMLYKSDLPASPGSVTQLRRCGAELVYLAKASGIAVVLVGHVTKDGQLAGPRLLEHLVDAVLTFEGDRYHSHRVVRGVKNRFGTTLEIGLFEMTGAGLREVPEGAGVAPVAGLETPRPGSAVCPVLTGSRCILVEIQALTATGFPGAVKRKSSGLDPSRLAMLIAVLEQHAGVRLADRDVFASAVGGLRVVEPASDLALLLAIAGAQKRAALPTATAAVGEVGLGGEVRHVPQIEQRLRECARLGYTRVIAPSGSAKLAPAGVEVLGVKNVDEAIARLS
jgi:DNA repair protein RadA/Sms